MIFPKSISIEGFDLHENNLDACLGHESPPGFQNLKIT